MRFEPPTEGLAQYERVVWARKQGIGFFLPFSVIWIVVLGAGGIGVSFALVGVPLGVLVSTLVAVAMAFWTRALVVALSSKFFLTNQRVVATRGGVIFKQVPLSHFVGVPMRGGGRRLSGERPARVRGPDLRPGFGRHRRALHGSDRRGGGRLPRARQSDCVPLLWMQDLRPRFHVQQLRRSAVACGSCDAVVVHAAKPCRGAGTIGPLGRTSRVPRRRVSAIPCSPELLVLRSVR